ncbi:MAG TPA: Arm DNA-binding domain-containing protein [Xanthobacteraceae bacterium]|jgi:hypothetical protein
MPIITHADNLARLKRGRYFAQGGLYLTVTNERAKSWFYRHWVAGRERWHGLGSLRDVPTLTEARRKRDIAKLAISKISLDEFPDVALPYLVRVIGENRPFGVFVASSRHQLYWLVDEAADPNRCEFFPMSDGRGFYLNSSEIAVASEALEADICKGKSWCFADTWRPIEDGSIAQRRERERISKLEQEADSLARSITGLQGAVNDKLGRYRRRSRKDAEPVEKAGRRQAHAR